MERKKVDSNPLSVEINGVEFFKSKSADLICDFYVGLNYLSKIFLTTGNVDMLLAQHSIVEKYSQFESLFEKYSTDTTFLGLMLELTQNWKLVKIKQMGEDVTDEFKTSNIEEEKFYVEFKKFIQDTIRGISLDAISKKLFVSLTNEILTLKINQAEMNKKLEELLKSQVKA